MKAVIYLLLLLPVLCMAQPNIDSLQQQLRRKSLPDSTYINTLNELGTAYWKAGNDSLAMLQHRRALAMARQKDYYLGEAKARLQLVRMEMERLEDVDGAHRQIDTALQLARQHQNDWIAAMAYFRKAQLYTLGFYEHYDTVPPLFEKARQLFVKIGDKAMEGSVYVELGTFAAGKGQYAKAIDYMLKGKALQESTGDLKALRATVPNLGVMYLNLKMYDKALAAFDEAGGIATRLADQRVLAFVDYQKGFLYKEKGQYTEAMRYYQQAASLYEETGAMQILTNVYARMAQLHQLQHRWPEALRLNRLADSLYFSAISIEESFFHYTNTNYARIYLDLQRYDSAIYFAKMGLDTLINTNVVLAEEMAVYNEVLARAYEATGAYKQALVHFKDYKRWSDTLLNDETKQQVLVAGISYDFDKMQQASELQVKTLQASKARQSRNLLLVVLLAVLAVAGLLLWNYWQLRKKNRALQAKQAEIEKALYTGQKIERKRLAGELHDHLNTQLAAVRWYLEAMDMQAMTPQNQQLHQRVLGATADLYRDMRMISHVLTPAALEEDNLPGALEKLVQRMNESQPTRFALTVQLQQPLPERIARELYAMALELTSNIARHAAATQAWIVLQPGAHGALVLSVADDGIGMPASDAHQGIGLQNIRQRVADIGACLTIAPRVPQGTHVSIALPPF
ncbi:MAG: histidine kinase [Chitinophagaceae bacterium]|jgi:signal transduction histidine kinase/tetratricopeptide (TPR) repeat protein|nr:histidine kinase [Chitinophagaceae bacterium]